MSRRVVAFRHASFEDIGHIRLVLQAAGIEVECCDLYAGQTAPAISDAAGLIFMGGPMSICDDLPFLRAEAELVRQAAERDQPVFGVCLGAQLIAKTLGAKVGRNPAKEIGWFDVEFTAAAEEDPVFRGLGKRRVFQWHSDTFGVPDGGILLATSPLCTHQAYHFGTMSYGIQFHPEVTPEMIADWQRQDVNCGDICELAAPIDASLHAAEQAELSRIVFGRWAELLT